MSARDEAAGGVELLPCPFCGRKPSVVERPATVSELHKYMCFVSCKCGGYSARAHQTGSADTPEGARELGYTRWNRRSPSPRDQASSAMLGALTPSAETKAAYIGEFSFPVTIMNGHAKEETLQVYVPWTTIKEIMAAILARSAGIETEENG